MEVARAEVLEWAEVTTLLARFAVTAAGQDRARALAPRRESEAVRDALRETREARWALAACGEPPWDGVADLRPIVTQLAVEGATLEGAALAALGRTIEAGHRLKGYGARLGRGAPGVADRCRALPTLRPLLEALKTALDPEGQLLDGASPRLHGLRRRLQAVRGDLQERLEALLADPEIVPALQERYVTVRNGRYVVPVRGDARRRIHGIVHDRSASGATLFIEPQGVVELNNHLVHLALEERDEEARLLRSLTRRAQAHLAELQALADGLAALDLAFAKAHLAERLDAVEPEIADAGGVRLLAARHPLLVVQGWQGGEPVVPIDLRLGDDTRLLLLTGPNAGGKTVALKTLGLLTLMAQAGLHLPVAEGSRLPVFERLFALIGDEQSLAENLSTFSSFVRQVREILERVDGRSLVLLDELGAGTDPAEGAALGEAILEALLDRGALVAATTHLEPLKVFAALEPRAANATVAFDAERLAPIFRIEYGHPGQSYALTIGARLGLPPGLIERARGRLATASRRLEALLGELEARVRAAEARAAEAARLQQEAEAERGAAREERARAEAEAERLRAEARRQARELVAEARRQVGHELAALKAQEASRRRLQEAYQRLRRLEEAVPQPAATGDDAPLAGEVLVPGLGLRGRLVAEADGLVTVQAGSLTVRVPRGEVVQAPGRATKPPAPIQVPARREVPRELLLLGQTTEEARVAVEKFLDAAVLAGHDAVRLVHGKGTGALRRTVERLLREHPFVAAFRTGAPREGGGGVTVVELREGRA